MKTFKEFLNEADTTEYPEVFKKYFNKTFDLSKSLPDDLDNLNIIEKGYAAGTKILTWTFNGGRLKTYYLTAKMTPMNKHVLIDFSATFSGTDREGFALPTIDLRCVFALTFNKKGLCTGLDKNSIFAEVKGGFRDVKADGLTLANIKSAITKSSKQFL